MVPAVLVKDKIVTGIHHGDAFAKLSETEKNAEELLSGFVDYEHLKFVTEDETIYLKDIIILRHAQSDLRIEDGPITGNGRSQAFKAAAFLHSMRLQGYVGFCSPYLRCKQTSEIIKEITSISFKTDNHFSKQTYLENPNDFDHRVEETLNLLPEKSVLITHCDFIQKILSLTHLIKDNLKSISNCSITYIHQNRIIWLAKDTNTCSKELE